MTFAVSQVISRTPSQGMAVFIVPHFSDNFQLTPPRGQYNLIFNARPLAETVACLALTYENLINVTGTNLVFRPLTPTVTDQNNLIWNKNRQLSNVAQVFLNYLKEVQ